MDLARVPNRRLAKMVLMAWQGLASALRKERLQTRAIRASFVPGRLHRLRISACHSSLLFCLIMHLIVPEVETRADPFRHVSNSPKSKDGRYDEHQVAKESNLTNQLGSLA